MAASVGASKSTKRACCGKGKMSIMSPVPYSNEPVSAPAPVGRRCCTSTATATAAAVDPSSTAAGYSSVIRASSACRLEMSKVHF